MEKYLKISVFLFMSVCLHAAEHSTSTSTAQQIPSLISLSANYIANNLSKYKDALIETDNHDIINLVLQRAQLYRLVKSIRLRLENSHSELYKIMITNEGKLYTDQQCGGNVIISPDSTCCISLFKGHIHSELHAHDLIGKSGQQLLTLDCYNNITTDEIAFIPNTSWYAHYFIIFSIKKEKTFVKALNSWTVEEYKQQWK